MMNREPYSVPLLVFLSMGGRLATFTVSVSELTIVNFDE